MTYDVLLKITVINEPWRTVWNKLVFDAFVLGFYVYDLLAFIFEPIRKEIRKIPPAVYWSILLLPFGFIAMAVIFGIPVIFILLILGYDL